MANHAPTTGARSCAPFDPADWLHQFEAVGGAYTITDKLNLFIAVHGQTDEELSQARQMIVDLTDEQAEAVHAHIEAAQVLAIVGEG